MDRQRGRLLRLAAGGAVVLGVAAGSYGVASAASSGSGAGSTATLGTLASGYATAGTSSQPSARQPWGAQRPDETLLTAETKSKVRAAAAARLPNATVVRVETDADGNAAYEVHVVEQDGTPATVYVDEQFDVVGVQTGMPAPHGPPQQQPSA